MSAIDPAVRPVTLTGRDRQVLVVLLTAGFTLAVDFSILNVALPIIGTEVGLPLEHLQWISTSFALCAAGFTLLFGRISDLFGRRRLFLLGMALLGLSSLVGGLATTPAVLLLARSAQGIATAMVTPSALALLTTAFPAGPLRARALGLNGALMAAGFTTGALLGGVISDLLSWRWAFFINVGVAALVLLLAPRILQESRGSGRPALDVPGAVTVTGGLLAAVYGLTRAGETTWNDPQALAALGVAAVLLSAFWWVEQRVPSPLIALSVLRRSTVAWGNIAGVMAFLTETSLVFLITLYLQRVLGFTPLQAGLSFSVLGLGTVLGGMVGPIIIRRLGQRRALVCSLFVQALATAPLAWMTISHAWIVPLLVLSFLGGVSNLSAIVAFMVTATSDLPDGEQGLATGLATMSQQVGITLGIPVMSALVAARVQALGGETPQHVLSGVGVAVLVNAGLCVLTALLIAAFLKDRSPR